VGQGWVDEVLKEEALRYETGMVVLIWGREDVARGCSERMNLHFCTDGRISDNEGWDVASGGEL
jgi:hypothetical protein